MSHHRVRHLADPSHEGWTVCRRETQAPLGEDCGICTRWLKSREAEAARENEATRLRVVALTLRCPVCHAAGGAACVCVQSVPFNDRATGPRTLADGTTHRLRLIAARKRARFEGREATA